MKWPLEFEDIVACIGMGFTLLVLVVMVGSLMFVLLTHIKLLLLVLALGIACFLTGYLFVTKVLKF